MKDAQLRFWARELAEADDQSWVDLTIDDRERYVRLAAFVWERIDQGDWVETEEYVREETTATTYRRGIVKAVV